MKKQEKNNINFFIKNNLLKMRDYDFTEIMIKPLYKYHVLF